MDIYVSAFLFFAALGVLLFLYVLHFRNRALRLGPQGLRSALARALSAEGAEEIPEEELREGAMALVSRFRRCIVVSSLFLSLLFTCCILLTVFSVLPGLTLVLCGVSLLLLSFLLSLLLLRDLALLVLADLQETAENLPAC